MDNILTLLNKNYTGNVMAKKLMPGAIVLLALLSTAPAHANDWFASLFGAGSASEASNGDSTITVMGPGLGGGHPGVDPD